MLCWEAAPGHVTATIPCAPGNCEPSWLQTGVGIHGAIPGRIPIAIGNEGRKSAPILRKDDCDLLVYSREPYSHLYKGL